MKLRISLFFIALASILAATSALAYDTYDCSGLPEWKRQAYYQPGTEVQYQEVAYRNEEASKRDFPDQGYPWISLGDCEATGGGGGGGDPVAPQDLQIYGAWHCGNDYCTWATAREIQEFDSQNHWLIDRGDGRPSVNLVVLSFVHPLRLLHGTSDDQTVNGVPKGMTHELVSYFTSRGIRVMLSIGGITYVDAWNQALAEDAEQLGLNAAAVAEELGVGIEIDYEENRNPNLEGLQRFIEAYRSVHGYDSSGENHAARLTIDLAAGDRWLIALTEKATSEWLTVDNPVLDYANAMVTPRQPSASDAIENWQEHVDGKPQYDPPIPPLAPAKFTGSLWLTGRKPVPECTDFSDSLQHPTATGDFVQTVLPNGAGTNHGMLGYMFWAAECQGTRAACTIPADNNTCEGGMGLAATHYDIPIPMPALRQE
jgi:hypothetical protein